MKTTLNLDDHLVEEARRLTGIREKTALVHRGLEELIARESARMLAALGSSSPKLRAIPRRAFPAPSMTLVDTSVWVDRLRRGNPRLRDNSSLTAKPRRIRWSSASLPAAA